MERSSRQWVFLGGRLAGVVIGVLLLLQTTSAIAQSGFDVQQFTPMPSQTTNYFSMASARVMEHLHVDFGVMAHFADEPLVLQSPEGDHLVSVVDNQLTTEILAALGLFELFELGLAMPFVVLQGGDTIEVVPDAPDAGAGLGDLRIVPRFLIYSTADRRHPGGISLGLLANLFLPLGKQEEFQGEGSVRVEPRFVFDYAYRDLFRLSVNAGYLVRPENQYANVAIDDMVTYGLGLSYHLPLQMYVMGELFGKTSILADEVNIEENPLEALLGLKYMPIDGIWVQAGVGLGLGEGFGNPSWRGFLGVGYGSYLDPDKDDDTYLDREDGCVLDPEDFDGFEDEDGCPDPDNDGDGILDVDDRCPDATEDVDDWEDGDGCPEPDNDEDTLLDEEDQCPNEPEDLDGWQDSDGCPDPDNDGDGFLDGDDLCPDEAETLNNFEDDDGCPDSQVEMIRCQEIETYRPVEFEGETEVLTPDSFFVLDQVAQLMRFHRDIELVEVAIHVDTIFDSAFDYDLSMLRADEVRRHLIERGVGWTRLIAEPYGDTDAIGDSATPEGRAANTRVEFLIIAQEGCEDYMVE